LKSSRLLATVLLTMLAAAVVLALPVTAAPQPLAIVGADLTTEVPGPGDPNGNGNAEFRVYKARVCYTLIVNNIKPATAAHIHRGVKGHTGPIVVPTDQSSFNPPRPGSGGSSSGCEAIPPALSMKLRQNSQRYYVNVHNKPYPHGAIRGQLRLGH
jgi:hypothetical protein